MKPNTLRMGGVVVCLAVTALSGCGGGAADGGAKARIADGGTFNLGLSSDPGDLDPQMGAGSSLFTVTQLAYDPLVSVDGKTGEIRSQLAESWKESKTKVTLTLAEGITCADGSKLTAGDVAANLEFVADPKNQSPFLGTFLPKGAKATSDDDARTVTVTLKQPAPFLLNGLASLPIVCPDGLKKRSSLKKTTAGTGPYRLTEAAPGDHYTYTRRDGYTWGPGGATTAAKGMPDKVVVKVVENQSTAANLLLSGDLNASEVSGSDAERLDKAGLHAVKTPTVAGEQWYNHAKGRATSDPKVRMALTKGLDLPKLQKVLTSGHGGPATTLAANPPVACPGDSVSGALPGHDAAKARALLDDAGWTKGADGVRTKDGKKLKLTLLYQNSQGPGGDAAAEFAVRQWKSIGVDATARSRTETALTGTIFGAGNWDVAWVTLNVNSPDQLVPFLSGPPAPEGTNFAAIADSDYTSAVKRAAAKDRTEGCDEWLKAESGLIAKAGIVPFANNAAQTFGSHATFRIPGTLAPTSIRMLAR